MHNAKTFVVASVTHSDIACDVLPSRRHFKAWHSRAEGKYCAPGFPMRHFNARYYDPPTLAFDSAFQQPFSRFDPL